MDPRLDPSDAKVDELFEWLRDKMVPAVREGRAQPCYLRHERCSDTLSGRCSMIAVGLTESRPEYAPDVYRWLTEIRKSK